MLPQQRCNAHNPTEHVSPHSTDREIEAKKKLRLEIAQLVSGRGWEPRATTGLDREIPCALWCPPRTQPVSGWQDQLLS